MAKKKFSVRTIKLRRQREGKTNYRKRLGLLKARKPRLVVRSSLKNMVVQLVNYHPQGDKVIVSAHSRELVKLGWKASRSNIPAAYLLGVLLAQKAKASKITSAVLDLGLQLSSKGSRVYAAVKGAKEGGLQIAIGEETLPSDERILGKDIAAYATLLKKEKARYEKQFSAYLKHKVDPEQLPTYVTATKQKILKA